MSTQTVQPAAPAAESSGSFRRAFVRYPGKPGLACQAVADDTFRCRWADILDISRGGIGLLINRNFEAGTPITILLKAPDRDHLYELQARVVNVTPAGGSSWKVGCQFITQLREDQVKALL